MSQDSSLAYLYAINQKVSIQGQTWQFQHNLPVLFAEKLEEGNPILLSCGVD